MSDRDLLAYAIILVAGLIYGTALFRWWYMSPGRVYSRRERKAKAFRAANLAAKEDLSPAEQGGSHD